MVGPDVARTDRRGRGLRAFLIAKIVGDVVTVEQVREATGVKRTRWYGSDDNPGRSEAEDFPDAMELYQVANYFNLGQDGWLNLLAEFGWIDPREDIPGYTGGETEHFGPAL